MDRKDGVLDHLANWVYAALQFKAFVAFVRCIYPLRRSGES